MAPHSSTLPWKILWMEEPGRLQSMGSLRVGHDWVTSLSLFTFMPWRRKWKPTPVLLPGESQGWGSLVGFCLWGRRVGHDWSDLAAAAAAGSISGTLCTNLTWMLNTWNRASLIGLENRECPMESYTSSVLLSLNFVLYPSPVISSLYPNTTFATVPAHT